MIGFQLVEALPRCTDEISVLKALLDATASRYNADFCDTQVFSENEGSLRIVAHKGLPSLALERWAVLPLAAATVCARAARTRKLLGIVDVEDDAEFSPYLEVARGMGFRSVLSTPIITRDRKLIGVSSMLFRNATEPSGHEKWTISFCAQLAADRIAELSAARPGAAAG